MTDWGALYRDHVSALSGLASDLSAEQLATPVPATPAWTVRDVLAHLAGGAADSVTGRMEGAPGPEWTSRHVAERSGVEVADLLAELQDNAEAVAHAAAEARTPAIVWDIAVHHTDIHEALDLGVPPEHFWKPVVDMLGPARAADLVGQVPDYEIFRAVFSRRSRDQVRAWGVLGPEGVDEVGIFGPRDDDQPVPA